MVLCLRTTNRTGNPTTLLARYTVLYLVRAPLSPRALHVCCLSSAYSITLCFYCVLSSNIIAISPMIAHILYISL